MVEALEVYLRAVETLKTHSIDVSEADAHRLFCQNAVIRLTFKTGDIFRGLSLLSSSTDIGLIQECADILVELTQYRDAAPLFEKCGEFDKSAQCYIKCSIITCSFNI